MLTRIKSSIKQNQEMSAVFFMFLVIIIGAIFRENIFQQKGVFTICKVTKFEAAGDGADLYITVYFNNKNFETSVDYMCSDTCLGKFFFCRVLPGNCVDVQLFIGKIVPDCILQKKIPPGGWKEIPNCK